MKQLLSKLKSIKVIITLWCMVLLTYIVATKQADFLQLAMILATAPLVYCGVNVWQDKITKENKDEQQSK